MNKQRDKTVLIVDDEQRMCEILSDQFADCNKDTDCPYTFAVDVARSAYECIQKVRAKVTESGKPPYDVVVLDVLMEQERSGLVAALGLGQQQSWEMPVRIIFTGRPKHRDCIEAMRSGVWDYIVKEDIEKVPMAQIVVDSAIARLRQLDLRREQQLAVDWVPQHLGELQTKYGGKLIALWHQPEVQVIASGTDAFELEDNLKEWRARRHAAWEEPFIVRIPPRRDNG